MKLSVNKAQRYAKMRAHTATHLLHAELGKIFPDTKQAGSLVDDDLLRFDFYAGRLLNPEEILKIEQRINQMIALACQVETVELSIEEASQLGAKMFFEEKYGDVVRVVKVLNGTNQTQKAESQEGSDFSDYGEFLSLEFCGGTHVKNTREIGAFTIISQEAVASGVKRIVALTGPRVLEKIEQQQALLTQLGELLEVKSFAQLPEREAKFLKDFGEMKAQLGAVETKMIHALLISGDKKSNPDFDVIMKVPVETNFKLLGTEAKQVFAGKNVLLATTAGNFLLFTQPWVSAKELAQKLGLKGGGNDMQVQGRDEKVVELL